MDDKILTITEIEASKLTPIVRKKDIVNRPFFIKLKESIVRNGLKNPLLVENRINGFYVTVGCNRLFVVHELHIRKVPVLVITYKKDLPLVKVPEGKEVQVKDLKHYFPSLKGVIDREGFFTVKLHHIHLKKEL